MTIRSTNQETSPAAVDDVMVSEHVMLAPERFYWALLDVDGLPARRRRDPKALGYLLENTLPLAVENVQATYCRAKNENDADDHGANHRGGRVLACGMAKIDLQVAVEANPQSLTLTPSDLPAFANGMGVDIAELNLLTGEFEPTRLRRQCRRLGIVCVLILFVATAIMVLGIQRRIAAAHEQTLAARAAQQTLIRQVLGVLPGTGQPPELRLLAELRTLRQTRQRPSDELTPTIRDVTPVVASLLKSWPTDLNLLTDSLSITPTFMTARTLAQSSDDVQWLANALASLDGWQLQQPEISSASKGVNATLQWKRIPESKDHVQRTNVGEERP